MSSDTEQSSGACLRFERNSSVCCHCNDILKRTEMMSISKMSSPQDKLSDSILKYCEDVANTLPQRQAFFVIDLADVLWKIEEWEKNLPNVEIFYAVRANSGSVLLELLVKLGLSFACASKGEIEMVLKAGGCPSKVFFAHTIKPAEELEFASQKGVELMTIDGEDELLKILRVYPNARILIRIAQPTESSVEERNNQFGCDEAEAFELMKLARKHNLQVVGISFNVGRFCTCPHSYISCIQISRRLFDKARELGFEFSILDIGGGFFGQYGRQECFYKMAASISESLAENFPNGKVRIIAEIATFLVGSSASLVTTVLGRRCVEEAGRNEPKRSYYLNDGIPGSMKKTIKDFGREPQPLLRKSELRLRKQFQSRLYGQTCSGRDIIEDIITLPELEIGERILWTNMGAYHPAVSSTFNGVPLPVTRYIFVQDERLAKHWTDDRKSIETFLRKRATFME